jgi:hypothetical protein
VRVNPKTAEKLRAEAEQRLEEERKFRPERKRPNIGKVVDELAKHLWQHSHQEAVKAKRVCRTLAT